MHRPYARLVVAASLVFVAACTQPSEEETVDTSASSIVGGVETQADVWRGTVALYMGNMPICGGSLVADSWVLTAGHCVMPSSPTGGISQVVIGRHRLSSTDGETRTVDLAIRHPGFNRGTMDNDLALLHLSAPSTGLKTKLVASTQASAVAADEEVTVVGWGRTDQSGPSSDVLRQVSVSIISTAQCKTFPRYANVTDNQICAGLVDGAKDSCQGDSGGPLFEKIGGEYVQVGLVSWGIGCARPNAPGVYTRIGNYLGWLAEKTNGAVGESTAPATGAGAATNQ
jgi:secreted trypsin-like serine protease